MTDPTPRGARSPDGVTAAVPCRHVRRSQGTGLLWACDDCGLVGGSAGMSQIVEAPDPLGVPGYAGAKGAVPEPQYELDPNMQPGVDLGQYSPGFGETPEPQGPITFTAQLRERTRRALGVCPTCGQPTDNGTREMGRIVGVPHSSLWRFLRGGEPSADLINKLVAWLDR